MAALNENCVALVSSTASCNLNAAGATEKALYTVPTGKDFVPIMVVIKDCSADLGNAVLTFGETGGDCDEFLGDQTFTGSTAAFADEAFVLMAVPAATPVAGMKMDAGEIFGVEITTAAGVACTATIDVYGIVSDA